MTTTLHELEEIVSQAEQTLGIFNRRPDNRTPNQTPTPQQPQYAPQQAPPQAPITMVPALDENVISKITQLQKLYARNGFVVGLMVGGYVGIAAMTITSKYRHPQWKKEYNLIYGAFVYASQYLGKKIGHWYGGQKAKQVLGVEHPELRTMIEHYIDKPDTVTVLPRMHPRKISPTTETP